MKKQSPDKTQHKMPSSLSSLQENEERVVADDPDLLTWGDVGRFKLQPIPRGNAVTGT